MPQINATSPLQRVQLPGIADAVYLKREDLLPHGGGNKVRRFDRFFAERGRIPVGITLSDAGAHTFIVLASYLSTSQHAGAQKLIFLELNNPLSPYARRLRQTYSATDGIVTIRGPLLRQLLRLKWYELTGKAISLGLGGDVTLHENPFGKALVECVAQLRDHSERRPVLHLFPYSSGVMARGFIEAIESSGMVGQNLQAVVTSTSRIARFVKPLAQRSGRIHFAFARQISWTTYCVRARSFFEHSGVWLDPVHTIHLAEILERRHFVRHSALVVWITCPFIDFDPTLL
ncbi:MAG: hypothetical protein GF398_15495 [Chitinivibrionales bacterium]|nr:hypothetical protein [Chitinivibrionales bacterium]